MMLFVTIVAAILIGLHFDAIMRLLGAIVLLFVLVALLG
jgi:hypothetical protein